MVRRIGPRLAALRVKARVRHGTHHMHVKFGQVRVGVRIVPGQILSSTKLSGQQIRLRYTNSGHVCQRPALLATVFADSSAA